MTDDRALPDDRAQLWTAIRYQIRFYRRTYRFLALSLLMAIIAVGLLAVTFYLGGAALRAQYSDAAQYLSGMAGLGGFLTISIAIVAAFLGGDAISTDFGSATGYYMLVLPVRRAVLLGGRYLAAALVGIGVTMLYFLPIVGAAQYFYGSLPSSVWSAFGLTILAVLAYVAFAFLLSSVFRRPVVSVVIVFVLFIIVFPIITSFILPFTGVEPWFMINYGDQAIFQALVPAQHMTQMPVGMGGRMITVFNPYVWEGAAIMAGYLVGSLLASMLVYRYKEVKG